MSAATAAAIPDASAGLATSLWMVAKRNLLRFLRTPQIIVTATMQSVTFLLIFRYVFGGAIGTGGLGYVDYMVPGLLAVSVMFSAMGAGPAVATDLKEGFLDRLRSLPMPRGAVISGRVLAHTLLIMWCLAATALVAFAVGFRVHTGWVSAIAAFGLCVLFGFAFAWVFTALGLLTGDAQAAQGIGFLVLPLSFASSAYVPVSTMPGWLRSFAEHQPVTIMIDAVRTLTQGAAAEAQLGHPTGDYVTEALLWTAGIVIVFASLAIARFRTR